ncbi:MAG: hypothetical protein ACPG52_05180 [Cognaticolwellia sp.]
MLSSQHKTQLVQAAIYAPSADNSQPFKYRWQADELFLYIDKERSGKASDNRFVLSDIAIGAIIENVVIQAQALLLDSKITLLPNDHDPYLAARIHFKVNATIAKQQSELAQYIEARCTDRRLPFKGPIAPQALADIENCLVDNIASIQIFNKQHYPQVIPVIQQAESVRFKSEILHQELFSTVKFNDNNAEEGMPLPVLAIERPAQPFFKLMANWQWMKKLNLIGAATMLGIRSVKLPIKMSPNLLLISIKDNDRKSVINGGRAIQRCWLQATKHGLSVHPYAAPGIFSLGFIDCEKEFNSSLTEISNRMKSITHNKFGLMFLRIGLVKKTVPYRTRRRQASSFQQAD